MSVKSINDAESKISTRSDLFEEMALTVGPNANWERFLVPAPICISLLGELICISTTTDFTLEKKPPKDGFKLLQWPNSFRTSLIQVANSGWNAFNEAHKNMDQIRLLTANVPGNLKDAVKILLEGTNEELEDMLPIPLNAIQETADRCLSLAEATEAKYTYVMDLTAELLAASTNAQGEYQHELRETEIALQVTHENKKTAEERKKMAEKAYQDVEEAVKKAENSYYQAMDSMPDEWKLIVLDVVEGLSNSFTSALDGAVSLYTFGILSKGRKEVAAAMYGVANMFRSTEKKGEKGQHYKGTTDADQPSVTAMDKGTLDVYNQILLMQTFTNILAVECVKDGTLKKPLTESMDNVIYVEAQLRHILKDIQSMSVGKGGVKDRALTLCKTGLSICAKVKELSKSFQDDNEEARTQVGKILSLQEDVMSFATEGRAVIGGNPTTKKAPHQRVMSEKVNEDAKASQLAVQNARFKIEQSSANLEFTREKYDKACDKMMDTSKKLGEILTEMRKLDIRKIDFENIRQTLIKGLNAIGLLRVEWANVVMFFTMMSSIIKCSLNTSLKGFLQHADVTQKHSLKGYPITSLKRDMIYQQAFQSAKIAYVVNMISSTYVEVSKDHLMDQIAGLGKLVGYDPEKQATVIESERQKLVQGMQEAEAKISLLVKKRKSEFDRQIVARMNRIRKQLEMVLPEDSKTTERTQRAAQKGIETVKESKSDVQTRGLDQDEF